jgi:hypothetical protein
MAICILCGLNFVVFCIVAIAIGGDAINGKTVGGHFYLASHGKLTEVSEAVFTYSRWHVFSLIVTHPLAMITGYLAKQEQIARKQKRCRIILLEFDGANAMAKAVEQMRARPRSPRDLR